jgi:hypothetical protein
MRQARQAELTMGRFFADTIAVVAIFKRDDYRIESGRNW